MRHELALKHLLLRVLLEAKNGSAFAKSLDVKNNTPAKTFSITGKLNSKQVKIDLPESHLQFYKRGDGFKELERDFTSSEHNNFQAKEVLVKLFQIGGTRLDWHPDNAQKHIKGRTYSSQLLQDCLYLFLGLLPYFFSVTSGLNWAFFFLFAIAFETFLEPWRRSKIVVLGLLLSYVLGFCLSTRFALKPTINFHWVELVHKMLPIVAMPVAMTYWFFGTHRRVVLIVLPFILFFWSLLNVASLFSVASIIILMFQVVLIFRNFKLAD